MSYKTTIIIVHCIVVVLGISLALFLTHYINLENENFRERRIQFESILTERRVFIQEGEVQSPAVIIQVNQTVFLDKVSELNVTTIYRTKKGYYVDYYVFTEDYNIAYCYTIRR